MKTARTLFLMTVLAIPVAGMLMQSCKKEDKPADKPVYLTVDLPELDLHDNLYYSADYADRSIELQFSETIDTTTMRANISFSDKNGTLDTKYTLLAVDRTVMLLFKPGFVLEDGWRYLITIGTGLKSLSGRTFQSSHVVEVRTCSLKLGADNEPQREAILCISDIHMGEARGVYDKYCWFYKNAGALNDLLNYVLTGSDVRQLVILGDLFDEWVIPYRLSPFDPVAGVTNTREYFLSVANSPVNLPIINKLRAIAASDSIELVYVPGNHDMLLTQSILEEIIPGVKWQGNLPGMGAYSPLEEMIMEHGHRYDFFNGPQPLVNNGHMLPPGFFISRLQAEGLHKTGGVRLKEASAYDTGILFMAGWTAAMTKVILDYQLTVSLDSLNIAMSGIDGYTSPFSYNSAFDMYFASIEQKWDQTQQQNQVPAKIPVIWAILDGNDDMFITAKYEYMTNGPKSYKIVAFGHTHNPMLEVYFSGTNHLGIYANSGSWVNENLCDYPVRTYLMIRPGKWTGSDLDVVSLYQYNLDSGSGNPNPGYVHTLLDEESIYIGN